MKKLYLSGKMSGLPGLGFNIFNKEASRLRGFGYNVVNPVDINPDPLADWTECIIADIQELRSCFAIALMPGWEDSYGARIEKLVAEKLGLKILFSNEINDIGMV